MDISKQTNTAKRKNIGICKRSENIQWKNKQKHIQEKPPLNVYQIRDFSELDIEIGQ